MLMYHGTGARHIESIMADGIKPRGCDKGNWQHTVTSNAKAVYLTNTYAIHFAQSAGRQPGERLAIFEVDTDKMLPWLFAPDEDFLEQGSRGMKEEVRDGKGALLPKFGGPGSMSVRTKWFRKRALSCYSHLWEQSVEKMGTCCYYGPIPRWAITRVVTLPPNKALAWMSDPTVTPLNHKIMGHYYRQLTRYVFGEKIEPEGDDFNKDKLERMQRCPREDVMVWKVVNSGPKYFLELMEHSHGKESQNENQPEALPAPAVQPTSDEAAHLSKQS